MRSRARRNLVIVSVLVVLLLVASFAFVNLGGWLRKGDEPVPAGAIVVLAGSFARSLYAAELYEKGYAKRIYVTRPAREPSLKALDDLGIKMPRMEDVYKQILLRKGVKEDHIYFLGESCLSTFDEAEWVKKSFHGDNCRVLVVTSPYHVKRAGMIFRDRVKECDLRFVATPYEPFPAKWWTDQDSARNVLLEVAKIVFYKLGGRFQNSGEGQRQETTRPARKRDEAQ